MRTFKRISSRTQSLTMSTNLVVTTKDWSMQLTHMCSQYVSKQGVQFDEPATEVPEGCILFSNDGSWGGAGSMLLSREEPSDWQNAGWKYLPVFLINAVLGRLIEQTGWQEIARIIGTSKKIGKDWVWSMPKFIWATVPLFPVISYPAKPLFAEWRKSVVKVNNVEITISEGDRDQDESDRERVETAFYSYYLRHPEQKPFPYVGYRRDSITGLYEPYEIVDGKPSEAVDKPVDEDIW